MSYYVVDVEADGQAPGLFSMVCFGAIKVTPELDETFYGQTAPITTNYDPEALAVSGFKRSEHEDFDDPVKVMHQFEEWVKTTNTSGRPILFSDNNGFDAAYMNYYFHRYVGHNPFGWSSRRIGDVFCGLNKNSHFRWKKYRKTKHTHHPVDDAKGNAEALLKLNELGMNFKFK